MAVTIIDADQTERLAEVRVLFQEYWDSFGFTPCFQGFGDEVASLPGAYAPPGGALLLARKDGLAAGCVALRRFDEHRGEFKRLYVRPDARGLRLGEALLEAVIERARAAGYRELLCDTMPVMQRALAMYERRGFQRIAPYAGNAPEAICLRLAL